MVVPRSRVARTTPTVAMAWSVAHIDSDLADASVLRTVSGGRLGLDGDAGVAVVRVAQLREHEASARGADTIRSRGHARLVNQLRALGVIDLIDLIVLLASGGFEHDRALTLADARAVVIVSPRQVRAFARASGRLATTDSIDTTRSC